MIPEIVVTMTEKAASDVKEAMAEREARELAETFELFDADRNGSITVEELGQVRSSAVSHGCRPPSKILGGEGGPQASTLGHILGEAWIKSQRTLGRLGPSAGGEPPVVVETFSP